MADQRTKYLPRLELGVPKDKLRNASKGRRRLLVAVPILVLLLVLRGLIDSLFGPELREPIAVADGVIIAILGAIAAQAIGKAILPVLAQRVGTDTAGQIDFLIRIISLVIVLLIALSVAGVALSGIFASAGLLTLLVGFASQQTLQQIVAGFVLLITRRVKVGDRVKIHYPAIEGQVQRVGLMYSLFEAKPGSVWNVPNATLLSATVTAIKTAEPVTINAALKNPDDLKKLKDKLGEVSCAKETPDLSVKGVEPNEIEVQISAAPKPNERKALETELAILLANT